MRMKRRSQYSMFSGAKHGGRDGVEVVLSLVQVYRFVISDGPVGYISPPCFQKQLEVRIDARQCPNLSSSWSLIVYCERCRVDSEAKYISRISLCDRVIH